MTALYFGVWKEAGHFLFGPGGRRPDIDRNENWRLSQALDGSFAPKITRSGSIVFGETRNDPKAWDRRSAEECPQGQFLRHRHGSWSLLQWWDRCQGDERGACNSTVLLEGDRTTAELLEALRTHFPEVVANLAREGVELVEVFPSPSGP